MEDSIERLEDRDGVSKIELERRDSNGNRMMVEMWHDAESLTSFVEEAMSGSAPSVRGMHVMLEDRAILVRETRFENPRIDDLYPEVIEELDSE